MANVISIPLCYALIIVGPLSGLGSITEPIWATGLDIGKKFPLIIFPSSLSLRQG